MNRRSWLTLMTLSGLGYSCWPGRTFGNGQVQGQEQEQNPTLPNRLESLGFGPIQSYQTKHYLGIGNASKSFIETALKLCEGLAEDYLRHFRARGFEVKEPEQPLPVVVLVDSESFAKFLGEDPGESVAGIYDLNTNELVMFDNRKSLAGTGDAQADFQAQRNNSIALFHEATHQLTFNTGLLNLNSDVPVLISEGLATYGEVRRPDGRTKVGAINRERLGVLAQTFREGKALIPFDQLLTNDSLFFQPENLQLTYAQAWLLVHAHLSARGPSKRFQSYLEALKTRQDSKARLEDFQEHLGNPNELDQQLTALASRMTRG